MPADPTVTRISPARPAGAGAKRRPPRRGIRVPTIFVYLAGLIPALWLFYRGATDDLGAEPFRELEHQLGLWALRFLIGALAVTPLRQLTDINLLLYRRPIGLLAFFYACLHLLAYMVLDQGLDWQAIWADIVKRPYITIGMIAFVIMVPLAITSNSALVRRMGAAAWGKLHRAVYLAAVLAALHFIMLVKAWPLEPLVYAGLVVILLGWRLGHSLLAPKRPNSKPRVIKV
jgi:sulfoxide reductase heme-binding subunit YedZ